MSRPRRALLIAAVVGLLALVPHSRTFAGQPVDPSTLNPPPPATAACMAVGNGVNGFICKVTFVVSDPPGPSGIVCGSGPASVELIASDSGIRIGTRFYDQNRNLTLRKVRQDVTGTFTNPLTGASVSFVTRENWTNQLSVPGDFSSANMIVDGQTRVYLPGGGAVLINTGRAVYAADGSIEFEQGPHPFDAYFGGADPTALEPICAAVGAP